MGSELAEVAIQVDVTVLAFLAGTIIPLLTAILTKLNASSGVKAICSLILSMMAGAVAYLIAHDGNGDLLDLISAMVVVYLGAGASYQNFWKPTGTSLKLAEATAGTGIGTAAKPLQAQVAPDTDQA